MGISFFTVSDSKVLVSTLIIGGTCCITTSLNRQDLIFLYLLTVPALVVFAGIQCCPKLKLTAIVCIVLLFSGVVRSIYSPYIDIIHDAALPHILMQTTSIQGCLLSDSKFINGSKQEFLIKVEKITDSNKELSFLTNIETKVIIYNKSRYFAGEQVVLSGKFVLFESMSKSDRDRDEKVLFFYASDLFLRISSKQGDFSLFSKALGLRKRCIEYVYCQFAELPHEVSELSIALLLGRKEDTSNPIIQIFREAGCAHLLALSGMHLQVLSGLILWILSWIMGPKKSKIITSLSIILFVFIAGGKPSLIRSMIMFIIIANRRKKDLMNSAFLLSSLACTLVIQSLVFPASCSGPGYFLSYSAILGIVVFSGKISVRLPGVFPSALRSAVAASIAAFTVSSPFLIHFFGKLYPIGIIAAVPLTVFVTFYMISSMIYLLPISSKGILLIFKELLTLEYRVIEGVSLFFSKTPAIIVESGTIFNAFIQSAGFVLLTVFVSIEYSIYKNRGILSAPYKTK
jgi:ComEC/Rec2-related protein